MYWRCYENGGVGFPVPKSAHLTQYTALYWCAVAFLDTELSGPAFDRAF